MFVRQLASNLYHIPTMPAATHCAYGPLVDRAPQKSATICSGCTFAMPVNPASIDKKPVSRQWSIWIKKIYEVDPLICKKCGSQMKIVGFIHNSREIKKIAEHLGLAAWRAPPGISTRSNTTAGRKTRFVPDFLAWFAHPPLGKSPSALNKFKLLLRI